MLMPLEAEQGWSEYHATIPPGEQFGKDYYAGYLKCNPCRLEAVGYCVLPDGTYALTPEVLADLDASDTEKP